MTKILITGGCGFIGSNLVEFLIQKTDWQINILDNLSNGDIKDLENINEFDNRCNFFEGDIRKKEDIIEAIDNCDFVVNLAAQAGVISSIEDPQLDAEINIKGLINVLQSGAEGGIKRIIQASSAAPLGEQKMPLNEKKVPKPLSPYGASKLAGEGYCSAFSSSYDLNVVALRFSNVYGPRSYEKGSVIPKFIKETLDNDQVTIYGDGNQTRDFIYVKDICNAIYLALTENLENKFELLQIATGKETSVNELFKILKKSLEEQKINVKNPKYVKARKGEILRNYADISKAKSLLNYGPKVDLTEGIDKTIKWFIENKGEFK
ncbi:NAD-dependent epimerase/dehydratase family protein [Candidatus Woesearchaeota archaeon]|nr:NAD-dependent epimerase/dehydratase family protein [Candidatus Woesearchaeota archaeon]